MFKHLKFFVSTFTIVSTIFYFPNVTNAYVPPLNIDSSLLKSSTISFYENNIANSDLIISQTPISDDLTCSLSNNLLEQISTQLKVLSLRDFIKNSVLQQIIFNNNINNNFNSIGAIESGDDFINNTILDIKSFTNDQILDIKQRFISINIYLTIDNKLNTNTLNALNFIKDLHNDDSPDYQIKSSTLDYFYNLTDNYFADTSNGYLMLTNKTLALKHNYEPENIRLVDVSSNKRITLEDQAALATEKMFAQAEKDGIDLMLISGYRDFEYQNILFSNKANSVGFNQANQLVALPGESEHQTGYVIDVSSSSVGYELIEEFENTKEFKWLEENASNFGFILRYPKDKVNITTYTYEPWHYRFIGSSEIAKFITNNNLTLEEYHDKYFKKYK